MNPFQALNDLWEWWLQKPAKTGGLPAWLFPSAVLGAPHSGVHVKDGGGGGGGKGGGMAASASASGSSAE